MENERKFVPVEMSEEVYHSLLGAENYQFGKIIVGNRISTGILVPVDTEEEYREIMRPVWAEQKKSERESRCFVPSERTGKLVRCHSCCDTCERRRDGAPLSLDEFADDDDFEPSSDCFESVIDELLTSEILEKLEAQSPELAMIFEFLLDGLNAAEIAKELKLTRKAARNRISKVRLTLEAEINRDDF